MTRQHNDAYTITMSLAQLALVDLAVAKQLQAWRRSRPSTPALAARINELLIAQNVLEEALEKEPVKKRVLQDT